MDDKKLLFIYNPRAGKGQIRNNLLDIIDTFVKAGYVVTARPTQYAGEAVELAADRTAKYDLVVCSGGDGTLDEVVTGIMKSVRRRPIGYIPAGSTNDFAQSLNIPKNMAEAAKIAVSGRMFACDVGSFNEKTFVYIAAFGLFTEVSYETSQDVKNVLGHMAYLLEGMKKLRDIKSYHMKITTQDTVIEDDFLYGMITNSVSVGGFKGITGKYVDLSDGMFEVTLVKVPRSLDELNQTLAALAQRDIDTAQMYCFKTSWLKVETEEEVAWTLDGEFGGRHTEIVIENQKQALHDASGRKGTPGSSDWGADHGYENYAEIGTRPCETYRRRRFSTVRVPGGPSGTDAGAFGAVGTILCLSPDDTGQDGGTCNDRSGAAVCRF